jgi:hypothetical protein
VCCLFSLVVISFILISHLSCDLAGQVTGLFPYGAGRVGTHRLTSFAICIVVVVGRRIFVLLNSEACVAVSVYGIFVFHSMH